MMVPSRLKEFRHLGYYVRLRDGLSITYWKWPVIVSVGYELGGYKAMARCFTQRIEGAGVVHCFRSSPTLRCDLRSDHLFALLAEVLFVALGKEKSTGSHGETDIDQSLGAGLAIGSASRRR